jgi:hypothetical protein
MQTPGGLIFIVAGNLQLVSHGVTQLCWLGCIPVHPFQPSDVGVSILQNPSIILHVPSTSSLLYVDIQSFPTIHLTFTFDRGREKNGSRVLYPPAGQWWGDHYAVNCTPLAREPGSAPSYCSKTRPFKLDYSVRRLIPSSLLQSPSTRARIGSCFGRA